MNLPVLIIRSDKNTKTLPFPVSFRQLIQRQTDSGSYSAKGNPGIHNDELFPPETLHGRRKLRQITPGKVNQFTDIAPVFGIGNAFKEDKVKITVHFTPNPVTTRDVVLLPQCIVNHRI